MLGKGTLFIVFVLIIVLLLSLYRFDGTQDDTNLGTVITSTPISAKNDSYASENLKFLIRVPEGMNVDEKFTNVLLTSTLGEIRVSRIGTNFDNVDEYLQNLEDKNKIVYENKESGKIGGYDVVYTTLTDPDENLKQYSEIVMFVDGWIYKFSTTDDPLRATLKEVAQSFEYKP